MAVKRSGGVRRAAKALGLSQPALSAQLRNLEEELGAPLFHRQGRSIVLNQLGNRAVDVGHEMSRIYDSLRSEIRLSIHGQKESLTFAVERDLDRSFFVQVVGRVLERLDVRPGQVRIQAEFERPIGEDLRRGQIDFAFTSDAPESVGLPAFSEVHLPIGFVSSASLHNGHTKLTEAQVMKGVMSQKIAVIVPTKSVPLHQQIRDYLKDRGIPTFQEIELWPSQAVVRGIAEGLGVGFVPLPYIQRELRSRDLRLVSKKPLHWAMSYYCYQSPILKDASVRTAIQTVLSGGPSFD